MKVGRAFPPTEPERQARKPDLRDIPALRRNSRGALPGIVEGRKTTSLPNMMYQLCKSCAVPPSKMGQKFDVSAYTTGTKKIHFEFQNIPQSLQTTQTSQSNESRKTKPGSRPAGDRGSSPPPPGPGATGDDARFDHPRRLKDIGKGGRKTTIVRGASNDRNRAAVDPGPKLGRSARATASAGESRVTGDSE